MKYVIASDIHGNVFATRKFLECFRREQADVLVLCGDLLYHGPRNALPGEYDTKVCAALLNGVREKILAVRGNCDAEVDQVMLEFPIMAEYIYLFIEGTPVFVSHGHHFNLDHLPPIADGRTVLVSGHTHIPANDQAAGIRYMNPGSIGIPKGGSASSYMVIDGTAVQWKTLEGQVFMEASL